MTASATPELDGAVLRQHAEAQFAAELDAIDRKLS